MVIKNAMSSSSSGKAKRCQSCLKNWQYSRGPSRIFYSCNQNFAFQTRKWLKEEERLKEKAKCQRQAFSVNNGPTTENYNLEIIFI